MRLNGWQRIGIIASVVWFIGAGIAGFAWIHSDMTEISRQSLTSCLRYGVYEECAADHKRGLEYAVKSGRDVGLLVGLAPIPVAWGFTYLCVWLTRWVRRGFQQTA